MLLPALRIAATAISWRLPSTLHAQKQPSAKSRRRSKKFSGRHRAEIKAITGVYKREVGMTGAVERVRTAVEAFETAAEAGARDC